MKILVIYDSVYGNTEKIAQSVSAALQAKGEIRVINIKEASLEHLKDVDLLLVGSPTQAFKPLPAVSGWLKNLPKGCLSGKRVAAFDTRMDIVKINNKFLSFMTGIFGYAAPTIHQYLVKKGGSPVGEPGGFIVEESEGPLREGELERAGKWAENLI